MSATATTARDYDIVVSADNNPYLEWQTMLFHHSCVRHLGRAPVIVVHGDGPLLPGYELIRQFGGRVQRAPSFRLVHHLDYPPRNTPGTLACVETTAEHIILCDPDMIFLRPVRFDALKPGQVSADRSAYLRIDHGNRDLVTKAAGRTGVAVETIEHRPTEANVPIVVPASLRQRLAREWIECIDLTLLDELPTVRFVRHDYWLTSMWAFVFAASRLRLSVVTTDFAMSNQPGLPPPVRQPAMLHYCYGDADFQKRDFMGSAGVKVWDSECTGGHGAGAMIREALWQAGEFYGQALDEQLKRA